MGFPARQGYTPDMNPTRRGVLKAALAGTLAGCAGPSPAAPKGDGAVDTHVHCFAGTADPRFSYHKDAPYRPAPLSGPEQLLRCMDGAGVRGAVIVHPEPYQDDHRYLEHCLSIGAGRLKGTCLFFADRPGSLEALTALAKRTPLVAARVHAYAPERQPPFGRPELRALWKTASDLGLAMQLHFEPRYAPGFEALIEEFRSTTVLIDHLGRPLQGTTEEHERVVRWSRFPNTVVKLSALTEPTQYPHRSLASHVKKLAEAFGPGRMLWGGGFGPESTPESYRAQRERARDFLRDFSPVDQARVLGGNAATLFRFA